MIERRNRPRLALEPGNELLIDDLDRHRAPEPGIDGAKNFAHAAFAEFALHLIRTEASAGMQ